MTEKKKKKLLRNAICIAYCSLQLLLVVLGFRGLSKVLDMISGKDTAQTLADVSNQQGQNDSQNAGPLICLDAGHGGKDNGSYYQKRMEKDDNLKITLAVADYLKEKDVNVLLTRSDDTFLSLQERCDIANNSNAYYFISLHRNDGDGNGIETWIHSDAGEETVTLAKNINSGLVEVGVSRNRGVKKGTQKSQENDYYITMNSDMPACIIEMGFINHTKDNQLFDENLKAYAAAIGDAIIQTYKTYNAGADGTESEILPDGTERVLPENGTEVSEDSTELETSQAQVPEYPKISNIESLNNSIQEWGQGVNVDEKNRPTGALQAQSTYGDKNTLFIGEEEKKIYLTFDEGYEYGCTERILNTLKEKEVKAVFFVTQPYAASNPEFVKRMIAEGHVIGNHSVTHPSAGIPSLSIEKQQEEVLGNHEYVKENFGYEMHLFRYPAGKFSEQSLAVVNNCGYKSVFWSFAYLDYDVENQPDQQESLKKMVDKLHPGAVYLLHAESETNMAVLGSFIDEAKAQGYEFVLIE